MRLHIFRIKKHLLLIFLCLACPAVLSAQEIKVKLSANSLTATEIFDQITNQTGYKFAYDKSVFDASQTVQISETEADIQTILSRLFSGKQVEYIVRGNLIVLAPRIESTNFVKEVVPQEPTPTITMNVSDPVLSNDQLTLTGTNTIELKYREPTLMEFTGFLPLNAQEQSSVPNVRFALKTNLLYTGATFTPNLAFEIALTPQSTLDIRGSYNWIGRTDVASANHKQRVHFLVGTEYRQWFCERFNGHFLGANLNYFRYNISGLKIPLLFDKENRYDGHGYGAGVSYGYHLAFAKRWGIEFNVGVGYMYMDYDRYTCNKCDVQGVGGSKHYFGPTRAGVNLVFMIK